MFVVLLRAKLHVLRDPMVYLLLPSDWKLNIDFARPLEVLNKCYHTTYKDLSGISVVFTSEFRTAAMLLLLVTLKIQKPGAL